MAIVLLTNVVQAQSETADSKEVPDRHKRMFQLAQSYSLSDKAGPADLRETPLFSWSTPERQAIGGELFLWTQKGRPLATIGIWTYDDIKDSYELQSLSADPLKATSMTKLWWQPSVGGLVSVGALKGSILG